MGNVPAPAFFMAINDELVQLRAEVKRLQRNAGNKISRLRTKELLDIAGGPLDPRKDPKLINKKYNTTQLRALADRLRAFNSRETQYVSDAFGRPMEGKAWREYKSLETKYNHKTAKDFDKIADTFIPNTNETIGQRMNKVTPDRRHMANPTVNTPYKPPKRRSSQITDSAALDKLTADMNKRLHSDHDAKLLQDSRDTWVKSASVLNDAQLAADVAALSPKQFGVLWSYTNFAEITFLEYHLLKSQEDEEMEAWQTDIINTKSDEARELAKWAKTLTVD